MAAGDKQLRVRAAGGQRSFWKPRLNSLARLMQFWFCLIGVAAAQPAATTPAVAVMTAPHFAPSNTRLSVATATLTDGERRFLADHPVVRVAIAADDYSPYQSIDSSGRIDGFSIASLSAVAAALGLRLEPVVTASWAEALELVRKRQADLLPYVGFTEDRASYLSFTRGILYDPSVLFGKSDDTVIEANRTLKGVRVAVGRDYAAASVLARTYPDAIMLPVDSIAGGLQAVSEGRARLYLGSMRPALRQLAQLKIGAIEIKGEVLTPSAWVHSAVRSDWSVLARILSRLLSGDRLGLGTALRAETAGFAGQPLLLKPIALDGDQMQMLDTLPPLRVGAVRGLRSLNDYADSTGHTGIAAEFTQLVSLGLGVPTMVVPFDSVAAMIDAAQAGGIDIVPLLTPTDERRRRFRFSTAYFEMPYLLVAHADGPLYWGLASLAGKRLALARAHPLIPVLQDRFKNIEILEVESGEEALAAVATGKAQAAVEIKLFAHQLISTRFADKLRVIEPVKELPAQFAFAVTPDKEKLIPVINRALAAIPASEAARIEQRWIAVDLEPERRLRHYLTLAIPALLILAGLAAFVVIWNRRLRRETRRRRDSEQRLIDMTERLSAGVYQYRVPAAGRIDLLFSNQSFRDMFRLQTATGEFDDRYFLGPVEPADRPMVAAAWQLAHEQGQAYSQVYRSLSSNGQQGWLASESKPRKAENGDVIWSGYVIDLTKERETQEQLRLLLQAKDFFIATASHELKSPLHAISMTMQWLMGRTEAIDELRALQRAVNETVNLGALIDDLLDLSQIETGRMVIRPQPMSPATLLRAIADSFEPVRQNKGLRFELAISPTVPAQILADPMRLRQVLVNLVGNAFKYTRQGGITLQLDRLIISSAVAGGQARCGLEFMVSDTGPGIEPERIERIFEPFSRREEWQAYEREPSAVGTSSTGLGLAISRRLVELMGGAMRIKSAPGVGTQVTFALEVDVLEEVSPSGGDANQPPGAGQTADHLPPSPQRVLLVDDDRFARSMIAMLLGEYGFVVVQAGNGDEATQIWPTGLFDAVVTDLRMPGMNGVELVKQLRASSSQQQGAQQTLFIALSASTAIVSPLDTNGESLFDAVLEKPIAVEVLAETLTRARRARPAAT